MNNTCLSLNWNKEHSMSSVIHVRERRRCRISDLFDGACSPTFSLISSIDSRLLLTAAQEAEVFVQLLREDKSSRQLKQHLRHQKIQSNDVIVVAIRTQFKHSSRCLFSEVLEHECGHEDLLFLLFRKIDKNRPFLLSALSRLNFVCEWSRDEDRTAGAQHFRPTPLSVPMPRVFVLEVFVSRPSVTDRRSISTDERDCRACA